MKRAHGFTLIELMITLLLAAIIMSLAVPGFRDLVQNNRAATQSNELVAALALARSEAVKRGVNVMLCPSSDQATCTGGDWQDGWIVVLENPPGANPLRAWPRLAGGATLTGPADVRFRPLGDVAAPGVFDYEIPGCTGDQGRRIFVNAAGQARVVRVEC